MAKKCAGLRVTPHAPIAGDITIGECVANGYRATVWCVSRCAGRDLDLSRLARLADYGLVELALSGRLRCGGCSADAGSIGVVATLRTGGVMFWQRDRGFRKPDA